MVKIRIKGLNNKFSLGNRFIRRLIRKALRAQGVTKGEIGVLFTTDSAIKRLNRKYLGRSRPTDVMAFSMSEGRPLRGSEGLLGDVVISVDRARVQARRFKNSIKKELSLYVIHGVLHLLGYKDGSVRMKRLEEKITGEFF